MNTAQKRVSVLCRQNVNVLHEARPRTSTASKERVHATKVLRAGCRVILKKRRLTTAAAGESARDLGEGELVAGIDLGTTNSCIAITRGDAVQVVPLAEERQTLPSIVAFLENGEQLVGNSAKRHARKDPQNTFYSIKRFIGCNFSEVKKRAEQVPYTVSKDEDGQAVINCVHSEEGTLYPKEISARILIQLLSAAEQFSGSEIRKAVISVPAYFDDSQREATVAAGQIAGLETVKLIKEPVAAALAYQISLKEDQTVMVLDLGGGTFDVSILEVGGGVVEVLSTGGDSHLGGDDWDAAIVSWLAANHLSNSGISWRSPSVLANLKAVAELAKIKLSTEKQVALKIPLGGSKDQPTVVKLTQADLDRLAEPLFKRLRLPVDACCWQAGVDLETALKENAANKRKSVSKQRAGGVLIAPKNRPPISKVLLVGGATRMPTFQRFVQNMTGIKPDLSLVDPDLAVAIGAAVHAGSLSQGTGQLARLETMDPLKRALLEALAKKELLDNDELAREKLGDEYDAFMKQQRQKDAEWAEIEQEVQD